MQSSRLIFIVGAFMLAAPAYAQTAGRSIVTLIDSTKVVETERLYVGRPNAITVARDGSIFVSDVSDKKVVRIDRAGRLTLVAKPGNGPGEVAFPSDLALIGDTVLAVKNSVRRRIEFFDARTLKFRSGALLNWTSTGMLSWNGTLLFGALQLDSATSYAIVADSAKPQVRGGVMPDMFRKMPLVAQAFGYVGVARDDSSVVELFEISNTLYRWHLTRKTTDSIVLQPKQRRGAKPAVIEELVRDPTKAPTLAFSWSSPMLVRQISGDRTAIVFYDPTLTKGVYEGPSFLQIADWRRHKSCEDVRLPVPADVVPRFAIRGDTLTGVVQHSDGADGAATWVVRWKIGRGGC